MNLFEFFVKLTHPARRPGWEETEGYFTGECRISKRAKGGYYPLTHVSASMDMKEYAIRYFAGDQERTGWYLFYPGPEPDPEDVRGQRLRIRYKKSRPWIFENISGLDDMLFDK